MSQSPATTHSTLPRKTPGLPTLFGLILLLTIASVGCRSTADNQIDLLERELRTQEDYIYELESYVVEYSEKLRDTRCAYPQQTAGYAEEMRTPEPEQQRSEKKAPRRDNEGELRLEADDGLPAPAAARQSNEITPDEITPEELSPEEMEVPDEIEFEIEEPLSESQEPRPLQTVAAVALDMESSDAAALLIPDPVAFMDAATDDRSVVPITNQTGPTTQVVASDDEQFAAELFDDEPLEEAISLADRIVDHLKVTQLFQSAGDPQQQSLLTVVEALDANGEPVDLDGEMSLMVMTTDAEARRRLKRWDFTSSETVAAWQSSDLGDGLHLELPLEKMRLPAAPLELWVRVVMDDGRKLLTQLPFDPDQLSSIPTGETSTELVSAPSATPQNPSPQESADNPLRVREQETPLNQPRWRASMQRTNPAAGGFAATSRKHQGWTTQAIGRSRQTPAQIATRRLGAGPQQAAAELAAHAEPTATPTTPVIGHLPSSNTSTSWSSAR